MLRSFWSSFFERCECTLEGRFDDKLAVITGANTGIGLALTIELSLRGARVIMGCRSKEKCELAQKELIQMYGTDNSDAFRQKAKERKFLTPVRRNQLIFLHLDLSSVDSIKRFVDNIEHEKSKVDYLINNAGVLISQEHENNKLTHDGYPYHFGVNFLGPLLLSILMIPQMRSANAPKIVFTSSVLHFIAKADLKNFQGPLTGLWGTKSYAHSKLLVAICAHQLSNRLEKTNIKVLTVDPGIVRTDLARDPSFSWRIIWGYLMWPVRREPVEGAQTSLFVLLDPEVQSGAYYCKCRKSQPQYQVTDDNFGSLIMEQALTLLCSHTDSDHLNFCLHQ